MEEKEKITGKVLAGSVSIPNIPSIPKPADYNEITQLMLKCGVERHGKLLKIDSYFDKPVIYRRNKYKYFLQPG